MLKKIKKHKNKLFILMLTLISALTLFLNVGKTYAYNTNQFSYTVSSINSNYNVTTNNNITIINNDNNNTDSNLDIIFNLNSTDNTFNSTRSLYILLNYKIEVSSDNVNFNEHNSVPPSTTINNRIYTYLMYQNTAINAYTNYFSYYSQNYNSNKQYYTTILPLQVYQQYDNYNFDGVMLRYTKGTISDNYTYFKFYIYNIDVVYDYQIGLQQYYDTYYGQIEENYNNLQELYNELQGEYNDLEEAYEQKQEAYDELENDYLTLEDEYNNLEDKTNYGIFGYLLDANFQYKIQDTPFVTINNKTSFNLNELQNLGIITSGGNYNGTYFETNYNPNYEAVIANFYFNNSLPLTLIDLSFSDFEGALVEIVDENGGVARFNINSNIESISYTNILEIYPSFSNFVDEIHITPNNAEIMGTMYTSNSYNVGYLYGTHYGFQLGMDYQQNTINDLNSQINSLNSQIADLQSTISLVQSSNEQLRNELSTLNENNMTWQKMFFTMADTPLKTVASVLGKDSGNAFLGINLYQTFIGLLTTLAIIWLIKRIL